jgi:hypothetical protein
MEIAFTTKALSVLEASEKSLQDSQERWLIIEPILVDIYNAQKRQQKSLSGFKTRQDAENAVTSLLNEINRGTYYEESDITFYEFIDIWLQEYTQKVNPKASTLRLRKYYITKLLLYFGYVSLKDISQESYQNAINDLTKQGYSKSTLSGVHCTAKMLFQLAEEKRYIIFD